jgi:hypothetical protein
LPLLSGRRLVGDEMLEQMHRLRGEAPHSLIALGLASLDLDEQRVWLLTNGRAGGSQARCRRSPMVVWSLQRRGGR